MDIQSPQSTLKFLHGIAGVPRLLEMAFDECKAGGSLIGSAQSILKGAIDCILLDWSEHVPELLSKGIRFLCAAIDHDVLAGTKDYDFEMGSVYRELAMFRWLAEGIHDKELFNQMVRYYSNHDATVATKDIDSKELDWSLPHYVNAGAYDQAIAFFDRSRMNPPTSPKAAKRPGAAAYIIALNRREKLFDDKDISIMLRTLFKKYVGAQWLNHGCEDETAIWMKIAFWQPGDLATEALLKCRDYVPSLRGQ